MMGTLPQWIAAVALVIIAAVIYATRELGFPDGWVTAIATSLLAVAAVVGLAGIILPIRQEAARRRRLHLKKLTNEVLDPVKTELESHYLGPLSRTHFLFDWSPAEGITLAKLGPKPVYVFSYGPTDNSLFEKRYRDVKLNHFPGVIGHIENFKRDFDAFGAKALTWVKALEQELRSTSGFPEIGTEQSVNGGCFHGYLAVYIFNRRFMDGYGWELTITQQHGEAPWKLKNLASGHEPGWGTSQQMTDLRSRIDVLIARNDDFPLVAEAGELHGRLKRALGELADIQTKGKLEGDCDATR